MNESILLDIFAQARLRAAPARPIDLTSACIIANLKMEGVDVAETEKMLSSLADAREKDFVEMDWALDELDKTQQRSVA